MRHRCVALVWSWAFFAAAAATIWLVAPPATGVAGVLDVGDVVYVSAGDGTCAGHKPCYTNIQDAVASAPTRSTVRVATGTYTDPDTGHLGYLVWIYKPLRLQGGWNQAFTSRDPAAHPTILDAQGQGRVVRVYNPAQAIEVAIEGFTIQGGNATGMGLECGILAGGCGGGIMGFDASLLIAGNVITGNVAADSSSDDHGYGGGVALTGLFRPVTATLRANIIQNNAAHRAGKDAFNSNGGGVYIDGSDSVVLVDNQVRGNTAARGGGVYVKWSDGASFSGNVIAGNDAFSGGGLYFWASNASTFVGNTIADNADAGLRFEISEQVHFEGNTLQGNAKGGASLPGPVTAIDNVISGNGTAGISDQAALSLGAPALIEGNLVSGNHQEGILVTSFVESSAVIHDNNIIDNLGTGLHVETTGDIQGNLIARNLSGAYGGGIVLTKAPGSVVLNNTIQGNEADRCGGGIQISNSRETIVRYNVVSGNRAGCGGGLELAYSDDSTFSDNLIFDNEADAGGGVFVRCCVFEAFTRNAIRQNRALLGGGVYSERGSSFIANDISDNQATDGGGVWSNQYTELRGNRITGNIAVDHGGGLYRERGNSVVSQNLIARNQATFGGAVYLSHFTEKVSDFEGNTVLDNLASEDGGGLYLSAQGIVTLTNNVLADNNAAAHGDQLYIYAGYWPSLAASLRHNTFAHHALGDEAVFVGDYTTLTMVNTLVVSHTVGIVEGGVDASVLADHTFFAFNGSNFQGAITGTHVLTGTYNIISTNERTGDPAFVDPRLRDYRLTAASDAIDAGIDAGVDTDINGSHRPNGSGYDIGADEWWLRVLLPSIARQYLP